jgi:phage terminase large subunit-like protein
LSGSSPEFCIRRSVTDSSWRRKVLRDIYGTVSPEDGRRRYRSAYISVGKKNGKSFLIGGLPLYHLLMEDERNPEAYGAAAAKDQAGLVFKAAAQLVVANPELQARLQVVPSSKRIVRRDGAGFYAVLSADGDLQDGIEPSLSIRDEVHRWKTLRAETLRDVLVKGQISRQEPPGYPASPRLARNTSRSSGGASISRPKKVLDGSLHSDTFYAAIWRLM